VAEAIPLLEALEAFQVGGFGAVKAGRVVVSHSGSGQSTSFELPSVGRGFTQEQIFALSEDFIQIYQDTVAQLAPTDDAATFEAMMADDRMAAVTRVYDDWTGLSCRYG
jgi:hypothetical protein